MSRPKPNFLECDSTQLENNLRFVKHDFEEELTNLMKGTASSPDSLDAPSPHYKILMPTPGFCIKAFSVLDNAKVFINICQTDGIPAPEDISEEQLMEILDSETPQSYRVPMSISPMRPVDDKSGKQASVCDVAVNPMLFTKLENSRLFRDFLVTIVFEGLDDKYNVAVNTANWLVLKNRCCMGKLVRHRVANADARKVYTSYQQQNADTVKLIEELDGPPKRKLIEEIKTTSNVKSTKSLKPTTDKVNSSSGGSSNNIYVPDSVKMAISEANCTKPEHRLFAEPAVGPVKQLIAEFHLPECRSPRDISVDVNEDRIVLEARKQGYLFDMFVDYQIISENTKATFNSTTNVLTLWMPVQLN